MNQKNKLQKRVAIFTITIPFIAFCLTVILNWGKTIGYSELILFAIMYIVSTLGITAGYHRLLSHKSFEPIPLVKRCLLIAGSMAGQGPILFWVSNHRLHHIHSDRENDPHSPHRIAEGTFPSSLKTFWHAHIGWMISHENRNWPNLVPDLLKDRMVLSINMKYFLWLTLGILIPGLINGLMRQSIDGFLSGILWGGLIRIFFVHHVTWSINSVCHLYGSRHFVTEDHSTNNYLFGLLALGEGFHNNHHAFPSSARHGLLWWQIDFTYLFILILKYFKLINKVKTPRQKILKEKRIKYS